MPGFLPSLWDRDDDTRDIMKSMHRGLDRWFENFPGAGTSGWLGEGRMSPTIDVSESDDAIEVTAELPGVEEKDIDVDLAGNVLTISGEKKHETEEKKKHYHRVERSYGSFRRTMTLPFTAESDKVTAKFDKGVLKVSVPKPAEVKKQSRKIEIKGGK